MYSNEERICPLPQSELFEIMNSVAEGYGTRLQLFSINLLHVNCIGRELYESKSAALFSKESGHGPLTESKKDDPVSVPEEKAPGRLNNFNHQWEVVKQSIEKDNRSLMIKGRWLFVNGGRSQQV